MTVRRAVLGEEPILRALRLEALAEAPGTFRSTYHGELVIAGNHEARGAELW
jgi:hypothetical protein